ncbi:MAG: SIS domain-containing protein [Candidatus Omnitrophica bacterium]|jgi:D-sedoheptulose 7-phosphate isomerase|nr:SIS domain-containing protein [Candidatus Omnitrophota bacterium]
MGYFNEISQLFSNIESSCNGKIFSTQLAINKISAVIAQQNKKGNKLIIIGNGGSSSIASHIATDFLKNCNIPACAFNDPSLITCLSNDLGYEHVFAKPIEILARKGDVVFAISSSGKSQNIIKAALSARKKRCKLITLSGFDSDNPLRRLGIINFYVPSRSYGYVEIVHLSILHCIADCLM